MSLSKALEYLGVEFRITKEPREILDADGIFLPGVGAFGACMDNLRAFGLVPMFQDILSEDRPMLGICLGLQLLFSSSEEMGYFEGLGVVKGHVAKFPPTHKVPQIGWNTVEPVDGPAAFLFEGLPEPTHFYFVHSFYGNCQDTANVAATTTYGETTFHSAVVNRGVVATQFHPEKSGKWGLRLLDNFIRHCRS
jgi:glutamine amidotransferase